VSYKDIQHQVLISHYANLVMEQRALRSLVHPTIETIHKEKYLQNVAECSVLSQWLFDQDIRDYQLETRQALLDHLSSKNIVNGYQFTVLEYERSNLITVKLTKQVIEETSTLKHLQIHFLVSLIPQHIKIVLCTGDENSIRDIVHTQNIRLDDKPDFAQIIVTLFTDYIKEI